MLSASTSGLRELFIKLGRFIHRDDLYDDKGGIRPGAKIPGQGTSCCGKDTPGSCMTSPKMVPTRRSKGIPSRGIGSGVYQFPNSSTRKISKDGKMVHSLTGFCQLASWDGQIHSDAAQHSQTATPDVSDAASDKAEDSDRPPVVIKTSQLRRFRFRFGRGATCLSDIGRVPGLPAFPFEPSATARDALLGNQLRFRCMQDRLLCQHIEPDIAWAIDKRLRKQTPHQSPRGRSRFPAHSQLVCAQGKCLCKDTESDAALDAQLLT